MWIGINGKLFSFGMEEVKCWKFVINNRYNIKYNVRRSLIVYLLVIFVYNIIL